MKSIIKARTLVPLFALVMFAVTFTPRADASVTLKLVSVRAGYTDVGYGGNYYVYPYNFTIDGKGPVALICDDFNDDIYINESWQADVYNITNVADADHGQMQLEANSLAALHGQNRAKAYLEAAYLYKKLSTTPNYTQLDSVVINHTLWALFDGNTGFNLSLTLTTSYGSKSINDMFNEADTATTGLSALQIQNQFGGLRFYTPVCSATSTPQCVTSPQYGRPQEFIGTVPEPATLFMVFVGLGLLGFNKRVRRSEQI